MNLRISYLTSHIVRYTRCITNDFSSMYHIIIVLALCSPYFGEYMSVEYIYVDIGYIMPTLRDECKLEGFCVPFGLRVWKCTFIKSIFVLDICCQQFGEYMTVENTC